MKSEPTRLKRVVFIHPYLLPYHYPRMQALMNACESAGIAFHNVALAGSYDAYKWFFEGSKNGSDHLTLFPNQSFNNIPKNTMWSALEKKLNEFQPDVIFIYGYSLAVMRHAKSWADSHGVAIAIISDSNEFDKKRYGILEFFKSRYLARIDAAFVGGTSSSVYLRKLGFPRERMTFGYDVVDNEFFCQRAQLNRIMAAQVRQKWNLPEHYFLFIGRLIKEKNLNRLFEVYKSYAATQSEPWSLVICGEGPDRQELEDIVARFPETLKTKILFYGHIKQPEIVDFYSCASCLVLPSISETWGLVVNEAMACGLPVLVSSHCGCAADLVVDDLNGWCFEPNDSARLHDLMIKVFTLEPAVRTQMGLHSEEIVAHWGLDTFARNAIECARIALNHKIDRTGAKLWKQ